MLLTLSHSPSWPRRCHRRATHLTGSPRRGSPSGRSRTLGRTRTTPDVRGRHLTLEWSPVRPPPLRLRKTLGWGDGLALVVGIMVGSGIFRTPGIVASSVGRPALTFVAWALGGAVGLLGALVFAELATRHPHAGGHRPKLPDSRNRAAAGTRGGLPAGHSRAREGQGRGLGRGPGLAANALGKGLPGKAEEADEHCDHEPWAPGRRRYRRRHQRPTPRDLRRAGADPGPVGGDHTSRSRSCS